MKSKISKEAMIRAIEGLEIDFLIYSYLYYIKGETPIHDSNYDYICHWLYNHMQKNSNEAKKTAYYDLCKDIDDSGSGFFIREEQYPFKIKLLAYKIMRQHEEHREIKMDELQQEIDSKFKLIVAGSRGFDNYEMLCKKLDSLLKNKNKDDVFIISGGAKGADTLGERYAEERGFKNMNIWRFIPKWKDDEGNTRKQAGYERNAEMVKFADAVVAFHDGESKGTKHTIDLAGKTGLQLRVYGM